MWTGLSSPCCKLTPTFPRLGFFGEASLSGQFCRVGAPVVLRRRGDNSQTLEGQREAREQLSFPFMVSSAILFLPFPGRGSLSLLPRAAEAITDSPPSSRAARGVVEQTGDNTMSSQPCRLPRPKRQHPEHRRPPLAVWH